MGYFNRNVLIRNTRHWRTIHGQVMENKRTVLTILQ